MNEKRIKELADAMWDEIIRYQATQEGVKAAFTAVWNEAIEAAAGSLIDDYHGEIDTATQRGAVRRNRLDAAGGDSK